MILVAVDTLFVNLTSNPIPQVDVNPNVSQSDGTMGP